MRNKKFIYILCSILLLCLSAGILFACNDMSDEDELLSNNYNANVEDYSVNSDKETEDLEEADISDEDNKDEEEIVENTESKKEEEQVKEAPAPVTTNNVANNSATTTSNNTTSKATAPINNTTTTSKSTSTATNNVASVTKVQLPNNYNYSYAAQIEQRVVALVNQLRAQNGLNQLSVSSELTNTARYKSNSLLQLQYFAHSNPQYGDNGPMYLMRNVFGIKGSMYYENIMYAMHLQGDVEAVAQYIYTAWYNSAGHRDNMLRTGINYIGVGIVVNQLDSTEAGNYANYFATQHFLG